MSFGDLSLGLWLGGSALSGAGSSAFDPATDLDWGSIGNGGVYDLSDYGAGGSVWEDIARTIPATPGSTVRVIEDLSGNGNDIIFSSDKPFNEDTLSGGTVYTVNAPNQSSAFTIAGDDFFFCVGGWGGFTFVGKIFIGDAATSWALQIDDDGTGTEIYRNATASGIKVNGSISPLSDYADVFAAFGSDGGIISGAISGTAGLWSGFEFNTPPIKMSRFVWTDDTSALTAEERANVEAWTYEGSTGVPLAEAGLTGPTYYVDYEAGDNTNEGLTTSTPLKTISSSNIYLPGTEFNLNPDAVYGETINLQSEGTASDPIVVKGDDQAAWSSTGARAVVDPSTAITGWADNGIVNSLQTYAASISPASYQSTYGPITIMLRDGSDTIQPLATHPRPDKYWRENNFSTGTSAFSQTTCTVTGAAKTFMDAADTLEPLEDNAYIWVRTNGNSTRCRKITGYNQSTGEVTFSSLGNDPKNSTSPGFLLVNHPYGLTTEGDWYYDLATGKAIVYSSTSPTGWTYASGSGVLLNKAHQTVTGAQVQGFDGGGVYSEGSDRAGIRVDDVIVKQGLASNAGIFLKGCPNGLIRDCKVREVWKETDDAIRYNKFILPVEQLPFTMQNGDSFDVRFNEVVLRNNAAGIRHLTNSNNFPTRTGYTETNGDGLFQAGGHVWENNVVINLEQEYYGFTVAPDADNGDNGAFVLRGNIADGGNSSSLDPAATEEDNGYLSEYSIYTIGASDIDLTGSRSTVFTSLAAESSYASTPGGITESDFTQSDLSLSGTAPASITAQTARTVRNLTDDADLSIDWAGRYDPTDDSDAEDWVSWKSGL